MDSPALNIYDGFDLVAVIEQYESFELVRRWDSPHDFMLTLRKDTVGLDELATGRIIVPGDATAKACIIESIDVEIEGGDIWTVSGRSLGSVFERRLTLPTPATPVDLPGTAGDRNWQTGASANATASGLVTRGGVVYSCNDSRWIWAHVEATGAVYCAAVLMNVAYGYCTGGPAVDEIYLYFCTSGGYLMARSNITLALAWAYNFGIIGYCPPTVVGNKLYGGLENGTVYCFALPSAGLTWTYATGSAVRTSPAAHAGRVYVCCVSGNVCCFGADTGALYWSNATGYATYSSGAVWVDGVGDAHYIIANDSGRVLSIDGWAGTTDWNVSIASQFRSGIAVHDDLLFLGNENGYFYCRDCTDGSAVWSVNIGSAIRSSVHVCDGRVYFHDIAGVVYCRLCKDGTAVWSHDTTRAHGASGIYNRAMAVTGDGVFTIASTGGYVTGVKDGLHRLTDCGHYGQTDKSDGLAAERQYQEGDEFDSIADKAETVFKYYIERNVSDTPAETDPDGYRTMSIINLVADSARGTDLAWTTRFDNLLEQLVAIAKAGGLGWKVTFDTSTSKWNVDVLESSDKSDEVVFSAEMDNLETEHYHDTIGQFKNLAYVGGAGEAALRTLESTWTEASEPEGVDRFEVFASAGETSDSDELAEAGQVVLREVETQELCEAKLYTDGPFVYETDWDLGDIVTVENEAWGFSSPLQIVEVKETYQRGSRTLTIVLGAVFHTLLHDLKHKIRTGDRTDRR